MGKIPALRILYEWHASCLQKCATKKHTTPILLIPMYTILHIAVIICTDWAMTTKQLQNNYKSKSRKPMFL